MLFDQSDVDIGFAHRSDFCGHFGAAWHKEVALFEFLQLRAKIKTKQTGTRLVVSMLIMSEDAKSDRPQVAAIGCRCMNSSTAWQAWLRRRSSRAQRMAWRMLVADNCGIMRAHSTAVRLVPWAMMPA